MNLIIRAKNIFALLRFCSAIAITFVLVTGTNSTAKTNFNPLLLEQNQELTTTQLHLDADTLQADTDAQKNWLGLKSGYFHPFLSLQGDYTDNVYNTRENETDAFITTISPGLWIAVPRSREKILNINPSNYAPGGLLIDLKRKQDDSYRRYQSYVMYEADILSYASKSENNVVDHAAEGLFQYKFTTGLSLLLVDKFVRSHDEFKVDGSRPGSLNKFYSNLLLASIKYPLWQSFRLRGDYSNFYLDYDEDRQSFSNRTDNKYALYLYYDYSTKTSLFINGEWINSDFDSAKQNDSDLLYLYTGMDWKPTVKLNLTAKIGYVKKDFDESSKDEMDGFTYELNALYRLTEKTSLRLVGASKIQVSDARNYDYVRSNIMSLDYRQVVTRKITAGLRSKVGFFDYKGGAQDERDDDYYKIIPYIQYQLRDWLGSRLEYMYEKRDSNFGIYEYKTNSIMLKIQTSF